MQQGKLGQRETKGGEKGRGEGVEAGPQSATTELKEKLRGRFTAYRPAGERGRDKKKKRREKRRGESTPRHFSRRKKGGWRVAYIGPVGVKRKEKKGGRGETQVCFPSHRKKKKLSCLLPTKRKERPQGGDDPNPVFFLFAGEKRKGKRNHFSPLKVKEEIEIKRGRKFFHLTSWKKEERDDLLHVTNRKKTGKKLNQTEEGRGGERERTLHPLSGGKVRFHPYCSEAKKREKEREGGEKVAISWFFFYKKKKREKNLNSLGKERRKTKREMEGAKHVFFP